MTTTPAAGTAMIAHTAASTDSGYNGITIDSLTATEEDDDTPGVTVAPAVAVGDRGVDGRLDGGAGHPCPPAR